MGNDTILSIDLDTGGAAIDTSSNVSTEPCSSSTPTEESSSSDDGDDVRNDGDDSPEQQQQQQRREGTITSARFNLLSSMVGGGSLSLPLAFHQAGNGLFGPILLLLVAASAEFTIRALVSGGLVTSPVNPNKKGTASYEIVSSSAFGPKALYMTMGLVSTICFFATVGYSVLLRDLLEPLTDAIFPHHASPDATYDGPTWQQNVTMLFVVLCVTPLCTLQNLTALQNVGAASMVSVLILGICVAYRSGQCNFSSEHEDDRHDTWYNYLVLFPRSAADFLDALPIFISCYVCHFNVLPVHNELRSPSTKRVAYLVRTTTWSATVFYMFIGFTGSMYGNCTASGSVLGNVLLSFDEEDKLLMVGRFCLALTIAFAIPMNVVPARDTVLRAMAMRRERRRNNRMERSSARRRGSACDRLLSKENASSRSSVAALEIDDADMTEPLLVSDEGMESGIVAVGMHRRSNNSVHPTTVENGNAAAAAALADNPTTPEVNEQPSTAATTSSSGTMGRIITAILLFWSAAGIACCVKSIDIVWDLLGSSLSIFLGWLIPCGSYLLLVSRRKVNEEEEEESENNEGQEQHQHTTLPKKSTGATILAYILVALFIPLMIICTANAIYNTFFREEDGSSSPAAAAAEKVQPSHG